MSEAKRPHSWPIRIYYEDTDLMDVVYYANYLKFFERARTELLRSKGIEQSRLIEQEGVVFAVKNVQVDYLKPAVFDDLLEVQTQLVQQKGASFTFEQTIFRSATKPEIICTAVVKVACLDAKKMTVKAIPKKLIEQIKNDN